MKQSSSILLGDRHIRCLLFDLGETLWVHQHQEKMQQITHQCHQRCAGLLQVYVPAHSPSFSDYTQWSARFRQYMMEHYTYWRGQDYEYEPDPLLITAEACKSAYIPQLSSEQLLTLYEAFRPPLSEARLLLDGVLETLDILKTHGILLGCVTDRQYGGRIFREDLRRLGLLDYLAEEATIVSADYGHRKPHAGLFLQAMAVLNVSSKETAVVGDFLTRDIAGAKRLQMGAIWKPKEQLLQQTSLFSYESGQKILFDTAKQQERAMFSETAFATLEPFLQPDITIKSVRDLLPLLSS